MLVVCASREVTQPIHIITRLSIRQTERVLPESFGEEPKPLKIEDERMRRSGFGVTSEAAGIDDSTMSMYELSVPEIIETFANAEK